MNRGLIDYMTYAYSFLCKGRGVLKKEQISAIQNGANTITDTAPQVALSPDMVASLEEKLTMDEARMINQHINECCDWLLKLDNM